MATPKKMTDEEIVETLETEVVEKRIVIGEGNDQLVFIQKPLTFFGKIEFFSVAGKAVEKILSEGNTVSDLLDANEGALPLGGESQNIDSFVKGIASIIKYVPEILGDLYCIILNVPRGEREYVKIRLEEELDDEQGFGILETFVDQNWESVDKFFQRGDSPVVSEDSNQDLIIGPIEALEAYSAEHPESLEELKQWHWKKFETLYAAFMKRKAVEDAIQTKNAMISGLWSNSNYDDGKNTRKEALLNIEKMYNEAILFIYTGINQEEEEDRILKEDPFFAAIKLPVIETDTPNPETHDHNLD